MIPFNRIKTIFFDYDGTLHNSIKIYSQAFRRAYLYLVEIGAAEPRDWKDEELSYWLGFNPQEMWKNFMPNIDENIRKKCSLLIADEMKILTEGGNAELYEGALETLAYLKDKEYRLVFISNCRIIYKNTHSKLFSLGEYFEELLCSEEHDFIPKYEILRKVKDKYPKEMVIIGDRMQDMEAGKKNDIFTIGCNYGFALSGELDNADLIIKNITDLRKYL